MEKQSLNKNEVFRKLTLSNTILTWLSFLVIIGVAIFCFVVHLDDHGTFTTIHNIICISLDVLFCLSTLGLGIAQSIFAKKIGETVGGFKTKKIKDILCSLFSIGLLLCIWCSIVIILAIDHRPKQINDLDPQEWWQTLSIFAPALPQLGAAIFNIILIKRIKK